MQAEIYAELQAAGFEVRGEVKFKRPGERAARADILVLRNGQPALIIEVKRQFESPCRKDERYSALTGLPCIIVDGARRHAVVDTVSRLIGPPSPRT